MISRTLILIVLLLASGAFSAGEVSAPVAAIVGFGGVETYASRLAAVHDLHGMALSTIDSEALLLFLKVTPDSSGLDVTRLAHVKNDVATLLAAKSNRPDDVAAALLGMRDDDTYDATWRDYCVQFLGILIPRLSPGQRHTALLALADTARASTTATAGTALIALWRNQDEPLLDRERFAALVAAVAADVKAATGARAAAFGVAAEMSLCNTLPAARLAFSDEGTPMPVRMAALRLMGMAGNADDMAELRKLASYPDTRLRGAALAAINKGR